MRKLLLISFAALTVASTTQAKDNLKWIAGPPGLPNGSTFAVVSGDPAKAGPFTVRMKFPADYAVPAHHHPTDEHVTVVSGKVLFGMGDKADKAKAKWMATGEKGTAMAKMNHFVFTSAPAEVEVSAIGPFAITYANPTDDPRGSK